MRRHHESKPSNKAMDLAMPAAGVGFPRERLHGTSYVAPSTLIERASQVIAKSLAAYKKFGYEESVRSNIVLTWFRCIIPSRFSLGQGIDQPYPLWQWHHAPY
jgi:hypothetical protein